MKEEENRYIKSEGNREPPPNSVAAFAATTSTIVTSCLTTETRHASVS